jgi:hypothetical protein
MTLVYSTGIIYNRHLRSSKYVYNTGHRQLYLKDFLCNFFEMFFNYKNVILAFSTFAIAKSEIS